MRAGLLGPIRAARPSAAAPGRRNGGVGGPVGPARATRTARAATPRMDAPGPLPGVRARPSPATSSPSPSVRTSLDVRGSPRCAPGSVRSTQTSRPAGPLAAATGAMGCPATTTSSATVREPAVQTCRGTPAFRPAAPGRPRPVRELPSPARAGRRRTAGWAASGTTPDAGARARGAPATGTRAAVRGRRAVAGRRWVVAAREAACPAISSVGHSVSLSRAVPGTRQSARARAGPATPSRTGLPVRRSRAAPGASELVAHCLPPPHESRPARPSPGLVRWIALGLMSAWEDSCCIAAKAPFPEYLCPLDSGGRAGPAVEALRRQEQFSFVRGGSAVVWLPRTSRCRCGGGALGR